MKTTACLLAMLLLAGIVQAQATTGALYGTVTDETSVQPKPGANTIYTTPSGDVVMLDLSQVVRGDTLLGYAVERRYVMTAAGGVVDLTPGGVAPRGFCPEGQVPKCYADEAQQMSVCYCVEPTPSGGGGLGFSGHYMLGLSLEQGVDEEALFLITYPREE